MKQTGIPVLSLRGVDFRFWSWGFQEKAPTFLAFTVSFRVAREETRGKKIIFNPDFSLRGNKNA